uniref:Uncharacterized protein n=1 Tax=Sphaerodactylus townsendi TaxID=933632 RepID=A0ACB8G082_9SAUR
MLLHSAVHTHGKILMQFLLIHQLLETQRGFSSALHPIAPVHIYGPASVGVPCAVLIRVSQTGAGKSTDGDLKGWNPFLGAVEEFGAQGAESGQRYSSLSFRVLQQ